MKKIEGWRPSRLLSGVSLFAICAAVSTGSVYAQDTTTTTTDTSQSDTQQIVVVGQRAALEAAQARKERADYILDSVSADDAGKLPDDSVTEVLQRVPGVSIAHFTVTDLNTDTNHYNPQGSSITVRGLSQVSSTLNGEQAFSANGSRSLSFEDVPPELLSAVTVQKSSTPDLIEGGLGGNVDLQTKLPFDFKHETIAISAKGGYSDLAQKGDGGGSALYANRWNTSIGEVGFVADVSYADVKTGADQFEVEPYYPQSYDNKTVYIPNGFDWGTNNTDVQRLGAYEATEWKPRSDLTVWQTAFRSDYWSKEQDLITLSGTYAGNAVTPVSGSTNTFNSNNVLTSSSGLTDSNWNPTVGTTGLSGFPFNGLGGIYWSHNTTTDFSEGAKFTPNEDLTIVSKLQTAFSSSQQWRQEIYTEGYVPAFGINLTGNLPQVTLPGSQASALANPASYIPWAYMDHTETHFAHELAWATDADYAMSDTAFLRSAKVGVRFAAQDEKDDVSNYNWTGIDAYGGCYYGGCDAPLSSYPGTYQVETFKNFFRGQIASPASVVFPATSLLEGYPGNLVAMEKMFGVSSPTNPVSYNPANLGHQSTDTDSGYAMLNFADDTHLPMPLSGNIGFRVVHDVNSANGAVGFGSTEVLYNGVLTYPIAGYTPNSGGRTYTDVLPALNFQFMPTENIHWRFAAYQGVTNPDFVELNPSGSYSLTTNSNTRAIIGASAGGFGNPNLKPEMANQLDTSLEWYMPSGGQAHIAGFYKDIHDYITQGATTLSLPLQFTNGASTRQNIAISSYMNNSAPSTVKGLELGWQQFFKFLPQPFDGLGIDANYTYIDSSSPGDLAFDVNGNPIKGLPMDLLSRENVNVAGMYEKGPVSLRLAYSWRSKFLLSPNGGSVGTYTNAAGLTIPEALPAFGGAYGQLDASVTYRITSDIQFQLQGVNLTDSVNTVLYGYGALQTGHSWYMSDRRFQGIVTMKF